VEFSEEMLSVELGPDCSDRSTMDFRIPAGNCEQKGFFLESGVYLRALSRASAGASAPRPSPATYSAGRLYRLGSRASLYP
jgi:hypothetical protein